MTCAWGRAEIRDTEDTFVKQFKVNEIMRRAGRAPLIGGLLLGPIAVGRQRSISNAKSTVTPSPATRGSVLAQPIPGSMKF